MDDGLVNAPIIRISQLLNPGKSRRREISPLGGDYGGVPYMLMSFLFLGQPKYIVIGLFYLINHW